jgi:hypothetical protein
LLMVTTPCIATKPFTYETNFSTNNTHYNKVCCLQKSPLINTYYFRICGPGSSVGIATGYGLNGPGIESRWRCDFSQISRPAMGPTQPSVQWAPGLSRG